MKVRINSKFLKSVIPVLSILFVIDLSHANTDTLDCSRAGQWWLFKNLQDTKVSFDCGRVFGKVELQANKSFLRDISSDGWNDGMGFPPGTIFKCHVKWLNTNGEVLRESQIKLPVNDWYQGANVQILPDYKIEVTDC
ncbi:MAG: hypothetical protein AB8G05_20105 [Oligoflexales bacterium]